MAGSLAVEELKKRKDGAESMSALDIALLGRTLAARDGQQEDAAIDREDEAWSRAKAAAKSNGPKSWFAKRVDFTLHEAHFLGRVGYSVKSGVVPLFDGAAIDLSGAELEAKDPKKAEPDPKMGNPMANKNWIVGHGGLLVLAPAGTDNVVPMITGQVIVTEKGLVTEAERPLRFQKGKQEVTASRIEVSDQIAVLYGVSVTQEGKDISKGFRTEAVLTGQGLTLVPDGQGYVPPDGQTAESIESEGGIQERPVNQTAEAISDLAAEAISLASPEGPLRIGAAQEEADEKDNEDGEPQAGFAAIIDTETTSVQLGYNSEALASEEDEDPIWTQFIDDLKDALKTRAKDRAKELLLAIPDGEGIAALESIFKDEWGQLKEIYNGFDPKELRESWSAFPDFIKDIFHNSLTEDEAKEYLLKLIPSSDPIASFLGMKEDDESETEEEDDSNELEVTLARIDLFPGLVHFDVTLTPGYKFSAFITGGAQNLKALWDTREGGETTLTLGAGIRGELSLKAAAALIAEIPLIIKGYGELYAKAALEGGLEDTAGTVLFGGAGGGVAFKTDLELPVKRMKDGSVRQSGDAHASLEGGLSLAGSVGTEIGLSSTILAWEKTLYEKEFAKWDLLDIHAALGVRREPNDNPLRGWHLETASLTVQNNFRSAFTKKNTPQRKYGLYNPTAVDAKNYQDISENFETALRLLEDFADAAENGPALVFPKEGDDDAGVRGFANRVVEQLNPVTRVWVDAQNELDFLNQALAERMEPAYVKNTYEAAIKSRNEHESRMSYLEQWDGTGNLLDYYKEHETNPGAGFVDAMYGEFIDSNRTYEAIVAYERARYDEKTKKHFDRITRLEAMQASGTPEEAIQKAYFKEMDGSGIKDELARFQDLSHLLNYEETRYIETTKAARKGRREMLKSLARHDEKGERSKFFEDYAGDAKRFADEDIFSLGNAEILIAYEKKHFLEEAHSAEKDLNLAMLGAAAANKELAESDPQADSARLTTQLRSAVKGGKKQVPELVAAFADELYRTATIDDLLAIELQETLGKEGRLLSDYLKNDTAKRTGEKEEGELTAIFGSRKRRNKAMKRFGSYVENSAQDELISCLTLDILMDFAIMRQKASDKEEQVNIAREIRYLSGGQAKMAAAPAGEARSVEEEYIAGYFRLFTSAEKQYREVLKDSSVINLPFMLNALSDTSENSAYQTLLQMKEKGEPDYKALLVYLEGKKDEKKAKENINRYLTASLKSRELDSSDVHRFYESRLAEASDKKKDQAGHYERYQKLSALHAAGKTYEELLSVYLSEETGAGDGYRAYLTDCLKAGNIEGREISAEELLRLEDRLVARAGKKHMDRLGRIHELDDEGKSFEDIYDSYEKLAEEQRGQTGKAGQVKNALHFKTGYQRSLKKKTPDSQTILAYEKYRAEQLGKEHAGRLRALLELPEGTVGSSLMDAPLLMDPEKKEAVRNDYLSKTKRFKKSKLEADTSKADFEKRLKSGDPAELKKKLLSYETGRRDSYEAQAEEIQRAKQEIRDMRDDLQKKTKMCHAMMTAIINVRDKPEMVFQELGRFKETITFLKQSQNAGAEAEAKTTAAYTRTEDALKNVSELSKTQGKTSG